MLRQGVIFISPARVNLILPKGVSPACPKGSISRAFSIHHLSDDFIAAASEIQPGYKNGRKKGQNPLESVSKGIKKACCKACCTNGLQWIVTDSDNSVICRCNYSIDLIVR